MAVILGTTPTKPAPAHNATSHRPPAIDSRTTPEQLLRAVTAAAAPSAPVRYVAQPTDLPSLRALHANAEARLLAAEIIEAGGVGAGITVDDLAKLPMPRLRALKAQANNRSEFAGYQLNSHFERADGSLVDTFINHRLRHETAA